ncbi:hypothetical protein NPIL_671031 [Nephila pilipes]|uniref:Uncharacterized protein n=1 Tax=Nephila pilipes TaxID=299642 RepID=A0A8X6QCI3_NEPPI|nr:hypothetical protein NPIL_671031 [Nephila pilipes]
MGVTQFKEWFNRFKDGCTSAENSRLTVQKIAEEVGVSQDSAHAILREDLNMNRLAEKFLPQLLSPEQKELRFDFLNTANTIPGF